MYAKYCHRIKGLSRVLDVAKNELMNNVITYRWDFEQVPFLCSQLLQVSNDSFWDLFVISTCQVCHVLDESNLQIRIQPITLP